MAKAYYPVTEAVGNKTAFNKAFDNVSPTVTVYDVLDRAMKVTLPDNAETIGIGCLTITQRISDSCYECIATASVEYSVLVSALSGSVTFMARSSTS